MKISLLFLIALSLIAKNTYAASTKSELEESIRVHIPVDEAGKWVMQCQEKNNNGRIFTVLTKTNENHDEEKIVIVSTPYKTDIPSIRKAIETAILPVKLQIGSSWNIVEENETEAMVKWDVKNEKSAVCKLILGQEALHSISYIYQGKNAQQVNKYKWVTFLRYAALESPREEVSLNLPSTSTH